MVLCVVDLYTGLRNYMIYTFLKPAVQTGIM